MRAGFLMLELLVVLTLVTISIGILMRHQAQAMAWQGSCLNNCAMVDYALDAIEDLVRGNRSIKDVCGIIRVIYTYAPLENPLVYDVPPGFKLPGENSMVAACVSVVSTGPGSPQNCEFATCIERRAGLS